MLIYGTCEICGLDVIDRAEYTTWGELTHPDCKPAKTEPSEPVFDPPLTKQQQAWFDAYRK